MSLAGSLDYEAYQYDPIGNRTSLRKRDGSLYAQFNLVAGITDSLGRATTYQIDPVTSRPMRVTYPEGNAVSVLYDEAGNVTERTMHAKPGSGTLPATITERAHYPLPASPQFCDTACWRPDWSEDGLGRRTDYAYNASGQLIRQDDPADAGNVRRRTIIEYVTSPAGISRRSVVRVCGVPSTGPGQGTCGTSQEHRTEYQYWGDTPLVTRERRIDGATGGMLDSVNSYDPVGRLLSTDGPLPGTADAVYNRYEVHGRKTWEIGPLAATGVRIARRHSYRASDDKLVSTETGTLPDAASTMLTVLGRTDLAYDSRRNPVRETVSSGATTYAVTDRAVDDSGRLTCQAQRMNLAALPAMPANACAHGPEGAHGPDRISLNLYDAAGQRLQAREGVATSIDAAEATWAYNANGQVTTVIDANGNRAELRYDGHMRQDRWTFPSTTRPAAYIDATPATALATAGAVNAGDYEEYTYDVIGNRTSLRKRDGSLLTYQYDNLNRMILKQVPERTSGLQALSAAQTRDVHYG